MANTYSWQSPSELIKIDQVMMAQLTLNSELFKLFPVRGTDSARLSWWQRDNYQGLMQMRGYDGDFPRVPGVMERMYTKTPGVYGERDHISEFELTERASPGNLGVATPIDMLIAERIEKLTNRRVQRMKWVLAKLITTGQYIVPGPDGSILDRDAYLPQTYTAPVTWATQLTARPLNDFRQVQLLARGQSVTFGASARALVNLGTYINLQQNQNPYDYYGLRGEYGETVTGLELVNKIQLNNNLPQVVIDDTGYISDGTDGFAAGSFQLWIPNNTVVLVGKRENGASIGEFLFTRNVSNGNNNSAPLVRVVDKGAMPNEPPPRRIEVYSGINGGPVVYYPGSIVVMTV